MVATKFTKSFLSVLMIILIIGLQSFTPQKPEDPEKPTNLKVLPKNISHDELINTMKNFCKSLGVRCGECHVSTSNGEQDHPEFDFASDAKPEKNIARDMMRMVTAVNHKYLSKAGDGKLEEITCVTCHRGSLKPMVSVDSLPKKENH